MSSIGGLSIVKDGLVLYLDAANQKSYPGSGTTWNDLSGKGNNGTLINGPAFNTGSNGSIVFDGINDYIEIPDSNSLKSSIGTINFWVKLISANGSNPPVLIGKHNPGGSLNGYTLYINNDGTIGYQIKNSSQTTNGASPIPIIKNQWANITFKYSSGVLTELYINGVLVYSTGCVNFTISSQPLRLSDSVDTYWGIFSGNFSNLLIYNKLLTSEEITTIYNATKGRFGL